MKIRYLALLLPLLLCCCTKNQPAPVNQNLADFTFYTQYDSIINTYPNSSFLFIFNVKVLTGSIDSDPITYFITNLPGNVTVAPSSLTVTYLLGGVFTCSTGDIPVGIDTMNLTISSAAYGTQNHKLILHVNPPPNVVTRLVGTYLNSYDYCQPADSIDNYITTVSAVADSPWNMTISNLKNFGAWFVISARVSSVVTIPLQNINGYTIWGSGTYTKDSRPAYDTVLQMTINDTLVHGADTERCIVHLQR